MDHLNDTTTMAIHTMGEDGMPVTISQTGAGPIRVVTTMNGASSFAVNAAGERISVAASLPSDCGVLFDEYTKRAIEPFPHDTMRPATRDVENLWEGRRLRLMTTQGGIWKEGQVKGWTQWNTGPYCPCTFWDVRIQLDPPTEEAASPDKLFLKGDLVVIQGLVNAKQHNGEEATVQEYIEDSGRFLVQYGPQRKKNRICVKPVNLKSVLEVERRVCRVNIHGGGTLKGQGADDADLLSFEWISPALPQINLEEGNTSCPNCRALQPFQAGAAARSSETEQLEADTECPVCMETASCLSLSCGHFVCQPCWENWCRRQGTDEEFAWDEEYDPVELAARRSELLAEFEERSPTQYTPPDCDRTGAPIMTERRRLWNEYEAAFAEQLITDWRSGPEGRQRFRRTLMEAPVLLPYGYVASPKITAELPMPAREVELEIMDKRYASGCFLDMTRRLTEKEGIPPWHEPSGFSEEVCAEEQFGRWTQSVCQKIGTSLEKVENYRAALPWHEKALERAQLAPESERPTIVSASKFDLGATHQRLGHLSTALKYYTESMSTPTCFRNEVLEYRGKLLRELESWTGTSGKMTPE